MMNNVKNEERSALLPVGGRTDIESQQAEVRTKNGYGTTQQQQQQAQQQTVEEAEAEEGPFPVNLKSMWISEFLGTCLMVQLGCAANCVTLYILNYRKSQVGAVVAMDVLFVALTWGLSYMIAIYCSAACSGGHLNPAVSLAFALVRPADFSWRKLIPYWTAQLAGAVVAALLNLFLFYQAIGHYEHHHRIVRGAANSTQSAAAFGNYWSLHATNVENGVHAFFMEAFGTGVLVFCIFALTHTKNPIPPGSVVPAVLGAVYALLVATMGPLEGGSFNPARDVGPRLVTFVARWGLVAWKDVFPYVIGPLIGGPIGAFVADKVLMLS